MNPWPNYAYAHHSSLRRAPMCCVNHLAAQIRLWLVPLLPAHEAHAYLAEARAIAEADRLAKQL